MPPEAQDTATLRDSPNYDVAIDADELLEDLAQLAAATGEKYAYHGRCIREDDCRMYRRWTQQSRRKLRAYAIAIAMLQPEHHGLTVPRGEFVDVGGTVNVREYMREISRLGDDAHERGSVAETAYCKVTSLLRDEYDIGWPRLDELGGNPLEEDLP